MPQRANWRVLKSAWPEFSCKKKALSLRFESTETFWIFGGTLVKTFGTKSAYGTARSLRLA
jgi:hypothetical protein